MPKYKRLIFPLVFPVLLGAALGPAPAKPAPVVAKPADFYWRGSKLGLAELEALFARVDCTASDEHFLACVAAVQAFLPARPRFVMPLPEPTPTPNTILSFLPGVPHGSQPPSWRSIAPAADPSDDRLVLIARGHADRRVYGPTVAEVGGLRLVHTAPASANPEPAPDPRLTPAERFAKGRLEGDELRGLYSAERSKMTTAQFQQLVRFIAAQVMPKEELSVYAGAAYQAAFTALYDPHSVLRPTQELEDRWTAAQVQSTSTGLVLTDGLYDTGAEVVDVVPGSSAARAGLRWRDRIVEIDGKSVESSHPQQTLHRIETAKPAVRLTVARGDARFQTSLAAEPVLRPEFETAYGVDGARVAYVKLRSFMQRDVCASELIPRLNDLLRGGAAGVILDLRDNPGGLVPTALCVEAAFLPRNSILVRTERYAPAGVPWPDGAFPLGEIRNDLYDGTKVPLVVLVNHRSFSAAEFVAAGLQDHGRAWLIGERTHGKATLQETFDHARFPSFAPTPTVTATLTDRLLVRPFGTTYQGRGVEPDFLAERAPDRPAGFYLHENERFRNAIPTPRPAWRQTRPQARGAIEDCMVRTGQARLRFSAAAHDGLALAPDYPRMVAADALRCELNAAGTTVAQSRSP